MGFTPIDTAHLSRFNSTDSCDFLDMYEGALDRSILGGETKTPSRTFAPSQIRCKRISWFRLRGVEPEPETIVDRSMDFKAKMGTACHQNIQKILSETLGVGWVDPETYLREHSDYTFSCTQNGLETQIEITNPIPIKFAPDGILFWKDKYWLLEIKTSEYSTFDGLIAPKPQHMDQIKCYATLLNIHNVLVLYQDRLYGNLKCFEVKVTDADMVLMRQMFKEVQDFAEKNIPPKKLPTGDIWCSPSRCRYYNKCKEW